MEPFKFNSKKEYDVVLIGRVAIDFNPVDTNKPLEESTTFKKYLGGSPANIAVGLSKLNKKVGFIGKVSKDQFGNFVTDFFKKRNIDTSNIVVDEGKSSLGLTFTEIKSSKESSILMYRNDASDLHLSPEDVNEDYIKNSKILVLSGTALARSPSREAALVALQYAKKNNVVVIFDIDHRNYTWNSKYDMAVYYSIVGKQSDIILGSREEFTLMESLILPNNNDDKISSKLWHTFGNKIIVIKHGKDGSVVSTACGERIKIKPIPIKLLKSFGGGDGYASFFIYGLLEKMNIKDIMFYSSASASMLVSAHSCSEAMPTFEDIQNFIDEQLKSGLDREALYDN
ncbi:MAG: 5-dehydro-2-deoxygluconokinase [Lachnospirales bacterium]